LQGMIIRWRILHRFMVWWRRTVTDTSHLVKVTRHGKD
jgi:hypothetical protein